MILIRVGVIPVHAPRLSFWHQGIIFRQVIEALTDPISGTTIHCFVMIHLDTFSDSCINLNSNSHCFFFYLVTYLFTYMGFSLHLGVIFLHSGVTLCEQSPGPLLIKLAPWLENS